MNMPTSCEVWGAGVLKKSMFLRQELFQYFKREIGQETWRPREWGKAHDYEFTYKVGVRPFFSYEDSIRYISKPFHISHKHIA